MIKSYDLAQETTTIRRHTYLNWSVNSTRGDEWSKEWYWVNLDMLIWLSESFLSDLFSKVSLIRDNQGRETVWLSNGLIIKSWKAWLLHVFMLFMLSLMRNDLILDIFLTRSRLKSIKDFIPNQRETELRWIRYIMLESRKGEMSHRVMFVVCYNGSGTWSRV
jgi:hypothetical protein